MQGKSQWLSIFLVASLATVGLGLAAGADSATESDFLAHINSTRSSNGLAPLAVDGGLRSHARKHTQDMMDADGIYHSTSSELRAAGGSGWSKLGENVGRGGSVSSLHSAFMNSPSHKANILGEYNYAGIGTGTKDGVLYVTVVFMQKGASQATTTTTAPPETTTSAAPASPSVSEAPPKTSRPAPSAGDTAPATTTTTLPPTTTTTTTLTLAPDKPVTPGEACLEATRFFWMCHD